MPTRARPRRARDLGSPGGERGSGPSKFVARRTRLLVARGDPPVAQQVWGPRVPKGQGRGWLVFSANSGISLGNESGELLPLQGSRGAGTAPRSARALGVCPGGLRGTVAWAARGALTPRASLSCLPWGRRTESFSTHLVLKSLGANGLLGPWPGLSSLSPPGGRGERSDVRLARNEFKLGPITS